MAGLVPDELGIGRGQPSRFKDRSWRQHAACRGTDNYTWYPDQGDSITATKARQVCNSCPVRLDCLAYAVVANEPFGIFGGCTERERRTIRKRLLAISGLEWIREMAAQPPPVAPVKTPGAFPYMRPDMDELLLRVRRRGVRAADRQAG